MKKIIFSLLMCIYIESFAAVVVVDNQPLPLEYQGNLYYWPLNLNITPDTKNLFITMDGIRKICFLNKAPPGLLEQVSLISIIIKGKKTDWNCFPYTTTYHEVRP
ncbi:hypothetical protein [Legionella shakespearei]|uniref:Secreted protein n=1 Tax=Legionella shakespearei DSM 23087 TaxID=1122169 RepID=A0A0W0YGY6_9GAMM|nr:hypothetical protein [Legionella shakespearei]KTD56216.1 hypothetical protein Lsha_2904 [Legionella shakespearei DSM 23087]